MMPFGSTPPPVPAVVTQPPPVMEPVEPTGPIIKIELPEGKLEFFQKEIERARQVREDRIAEWQVKHNLERYQPAKKDAEGVNVGVDFRDVERKLADLFFGEAQISVIADPEEAQPRAALLHQELLNGLISDQKMDAKATADKAILDCLVALQPAFCKFGYIPTTVDVPDPLTGQPVPIVVHETLFFSRISGAAGLLPADFKDTDYDKSPWVGYDWKMSTSQATREFGLPEDWTPPSGGARVTTFTDEPTGKNPPGSSDPQCAGVTLYYSAHLFDESVRHPDLIRELVLIDGWEGPVKHEDLACQTLDKTTGRLTPDSCIGFPLHLLALRDLPDSAHVPADSSQTGPLTTEINDYMTQTKGQKDSNRLILLADITKIDLTALEGIKEIEAKLGFKVIPVTEGALSTGMQTAMAQVPSLTLGRETYVGLDRFERFRDQILGISPNTAGATTQTRRSATETADVARNVGARFEKERKRIIKWWLQGIRNKLSPMAIKYGNRLALEILGPKKGAEWNAFREAGQLGPFTFTVSIDTGRYQDVEDTRRQILQVFNLLAKSPFANQQFFVAKICEAFGWDVSQAMTQPQPPKPEPPKVTFSVSGPDLDRAAPQYRGVLAALAAGGMDVSKFPPPLDVVPVATPPPGALPPDLAHGGPADKADRIDQHQLRETGSINNAPGASQAVM